MKKHAAFLFIFALLAPALFSPAAAQELQIDWSQVPERTKMELFEAQQLMNDSRYEAAIDKLQRFQKNKPRLNHFLVDFNIGTAYGFLSDFPNAIIYLKRAVTLDDSYAPVWLNLGKLYYQVKDFDNATEALVAGFEKSPQKNPEILFMAMAAAYQAGNLERAIELGEDLVMTYRKDTMEVVSLLANAYITTENFTGAVDMLTRLLERNPGNAQVWKLLTQAYFKNQQFEDAAIAYETYGYLHPLSREEAMVMGDLYSMVGVPGRAAQYYERALEEGGSAEEFEKMSVAYYSAYDFDKAIDAIDRALQEKENHERLLLKAQLYYLQDKFTEAQQLYVQAANMMSKDGHEWLMAGYCAMRSGELKIARELLEKATSFPTQRQEALAMLKMLTPVEEVKSLMSALDEQQNKAVQ